MRLIDQDGQQVGIVPLQAALDAAKLVGMDLVEVVPNAAPPVCRIMDYGRHLFDKNKKQHAGKSKQRQIQTKEVKFRPSTDEGDYQVKLRHLTKFLLQGDKVRVVLRFRGREMQHRELGLDLLQRVASDLAECGVVEQEPKLEGRMLAMAMVPKKRR